MQTTVQDTSRTLETRRLILRPIAESDLEDLYAFHSQPNVGPAAGWKPHESRQETLEILRTLFIGQPGMFGIVWSQVAADILTVALSLYIYRKYGPSAGMLQPER